MPKVVITGGSGLLGPSVIKEFLNNGYEVVNADTKKPKEELCRTVITDLTNLGEVHGVLVGADAVVHLAAIPVAYSHPNEVTFQNNVMSTYNILEAAGNLGIKKAVITSSESSYGIVFTRNSLEPKYVPIDEEHPQLPEDSYGLSKIVNEQTADMIHRRTGMQVVSMRLGNVITPEMYANFPSFIRVPEQRKTILWSYIDSRDAATAYRLAVETDGLGSVALNIANDESSMDIESKQLMELVYPNVKEFKKELNRFETLFSNEKAKKLLNWQPVHRWRNYVEVSKS
ncbi:NAD-dependent epimerase/dehydratase family protein [Lederbergia wuyishanensis]|uniref:Nucleoside-diphosphate-sugar epimerase n=1 Tax=Lederbergia wuyishanensis TaxID=1347903 RepID=A0ABU0D316_9BACI|nr:NAD(P)-dependent oxidoreductase [Lederbergia wuyishanensis]MCJ8007058.1 NAD(P)-dependent oxidoreductase [Lederbergia wuyishanensis]MDQ0342798.1 nucleoside-diphosphate-sugar epimerase [Lederbergia wuyishanensis]